MIQAGWDGYIHVWRLNGSDLPGWPVKPPKPESSGLTVIDDQKLDTAWTSSARLRSRRGRRV